MKPTNVLDLFWFAKTGRKYANWKERYRPVG
jgi:hypothetical protein